MRTIGAGLLALAMTASSTFAATAQTDAATGPLAPGKPAGVQQAQIETGGVLLVGGILVIAGVIALIATNTQGNKSTSATSTH